MRWLFHVARVEDVSWGKDGRYAPASLGRDGFIHASYKDAVVASARLYFPDDARPLVLVIDPRRLDVRVEVVETPRGPMPHVHGPIPSDAIGVLGLDAVAEHDDVVRGGNIGFLAYDGVSLLDLVGPLDALSRIASMGFDRNLACEVVALGAAGEDPVSSTHGLHVRTTRHRPALDDFDVLVVPGGRGASAVQDEPDVADYLATFPPNRLVASVGTGALLLGAAGRLEGKRATTDPGAMKELARYGAIATEARVIDEGQLVTAAGAAAGIDLGLHLVRRLAGDDAFERIKERMAALEVPGATVAGGDRPLA